MALVGETADLADEAADHYGELLDAMQLFGTDASTHATANLFVPEPKPNSPPSGATFLPVPGSCVSSACIGAFGDLATVSGVLARYVEDVRSLDESVSQLAGSLVLGAMPETQEYWIRRVDGDLAQLEASESEVRTLLEPEGVAACRAELDEG